MLLGKLVKCKIPDLTGMMNIFYRHDDPPRSFYAGGRFRARVERGGGSCEGYWVLSDPNNPGLEGPIVHGWPKDTERKEGNAIITGSISGHEEFPCALVKIDGIEYV